MAGLDDIAPAPEPGEATLQQELDAFLASAEGDVLLWHDAAGAYDEVVGWLGLPGDVVLVREDFGSRLDLARRLNDVSPDERVLFYRRHEEVIEPDDWFCDLEARCVRFRPTCGAAGAEVAPGPETEPVTEPAAELTAEPEAPAEASTPVLEKAGDPVAVAVAADGAAELDQDWYTLEEFTQLASGHSAESLGFRAYADCVVANRFAGLWDYYDSLFELPIVSKDDLDSDLLGAQSFVMYTYQHAQRGQLFDYEEGSWITLAGLRELEISDSTIRDFVGGALGAAAEVGLDCFTVPWLRRQKVGLELLDYGLSDCFYESVLFSCGQNVSSSRCCKRRIFAAKGDGCRGRDLVRVLVSREGNLAADDLVDDLREVFGIRISRSQLIDLARKAGLFYSPELGRIYTDHQMFVDEVE